MLKQRFVFAVSLFAILAVGNVWADTASGDAVKTAHDVYTDLSTTETGIAGVSYVNKMVNAAGAAAQDAENHAASAGASALSAAAAASAAQTAANNAQTTANNVANKFDNTSTVKNAIVTTDADGKVAPVAISDTGTGTYVTGVTVSGGVVTLSRGTPTAYSLPTASASTKGGVKIGANVNVATDGTISVPTATSGALGVVKTGTNITNNNGTISVTTIATPTQGSAVPLTSGGAYTALAAKEATANKLKTTDTTAVTDTNKDTLYPSVGKTQAMIDSKVAGLDKSDTAETGKYVSAVSETDGVITVSRASLPTVGNATLTIQRNGTTVDTFTANATSNKTINITDNDTVYTLPNATTTTKGGVIVGSNISVSNGTISVPVATSGALGVVKTGTNITNNSGTISVTTTATPTQGSAVPLTSGGAYTALTAKEATANKAASSEAATTIGKTVAYPTVSFMETYVGQMTNDLISDVGDTSELTTENTDSLVDAINEVDAEAAAKLATVSSTGSGVVKTVVKDGTAVKVTAGTVATADIADGAVTTAKIKDANVTTAKIADGAVTVAKTTGLYGVIPSGSQGNTAATAFIWVE